MPPRRWSIGLHGLDFADIPARVVGTAKHCCSMVFAALWSAPSSPGPGPRHLGFARLEGSVTRSSSALAETAAAPPPYAQTARSCSGFEARKTSTAGPAAQRITDHTGAAGRRAGGSARNQAPMSGADALTPAVVGFEWVRRVGLALHGAQMLSRGWHYRRGVSATHPAAMTTGKSATSGPRPNWRTPSVGGAPSPVG